MTFRPLLRLAGVLLLALGLGGCQGLQLPSHPVRDVTPWAVSGGSEGRTNAADVAVAPLLEPTWTYNAEAGFGPASPVLRGDAVLVATRKGDLHAIGLADGRRIGYVSVGGSVEGGLAVVGDALYGASAMGKRPVFRYDLHGGRIAWRTESDPVLGGVLVLGDKVIVADATGGVAAYGIDDGAERWRLDSPAARTFRAAPVQTPAGVLVADDRGHLTLVDPKDGHLVWAMDASAPIYATPAVQRGHIYLSSTRGTVEALSVEGASVWIYRLGDATVRFTAPAVLDASVVVGGTDGYVRALDAQTGGERWATTVGAAVVGAPLLSRDVVFIGTMDKRLLALSRQDGRLLASMELRGRMKSAMALVDGSVIVLSEPRYVYRFDPQSILQP